MRECSYTEREIQVPARRSHRSSGMPIDSRERHGPAIRPRREGHQRSVVAVAAERTLPRRSYHIDRCRRQETREYELARDHRGRARRPSRRACPKPAQGEEPRAGETRTTPGGQAGGAAHWLHKTQRARTDENSSLLGRIAAARRVSIQRRARDRTRSTSCPLCAPRFGSERRPPSWGGPRAVGARVSRRQSRLSPRCRLFERSFTSGRVKAIPAHPGTPPPTLLRPSTRSWTR
jgi:hypothetical protein